MKKRIVSVALVAVMIVAMIPAMALSTSAMNFYDGYETPKVQDGDITLDAASTPDAAYTGDKIESTYFHTNNEATSFVAYTAAGPKGLYLWARINDPSLDKGQVMIENDDGEEEIYQTPWNKGDYFQFFIRCETAAAENWGSFTYDYVGNLNAENGTYTKFSTENVVAKTTVIEGEAWILETYIPYTATNVLTEDQTVDDITFFSVGFQYCNHTNDQANTRKALIYDRSGGTSFYLGMSWHAGSANNNFKGSWFTPLSFAGYTTAVVTDAPVMDGAKDDVYALSEAIKSGRAADENSSFVAYAVATLQGVYIYADIVDTTLDKLDFEYPNLGDKFQVYFNFGDRLTTLHWSHVELDYRDGMYALSDYENDVLKEDAVLKPAYRYLAKGSWSSKNPYPSDKIEYATRRHYNADGTASGWSAEVFLPWGGESAYNNIYELTDIDFSIGIQVNDHKIKEESNLPSTYRESYTGVVSYDSGDGFKYYYAPDNKEGSGNKWFQPLIFDFQAGVPALIKNWANYSATELTLDGVKDAAYSAYTRHQAAYYQQSYPESKAFFPGDEGYSNLFDVYYTFTDNYVYVLTEVFDDTYYGTYSGTVGNNDYVSIYWSNNDHMGKFNIGADKTFNNNGNYEGYAYASNYVIYDGTNADTANIALTYKGTPGEDDYTGYFVEAKLPLASADKAKLVAGKAVNFQIGVEVLNWATVDIGGTPTAKRLGFAYSNCLGGYWWMQNNYHNAGHRLMPKFILDKTLTDASFAVEPDIIGTALYLGQNINVNYVVQLPANMTNAVVRFSHDGKEYYANAEKYAGVSNAYSFTFEGLAPQAMGDMILAELILDGIVIDSHAGVPAKEYCERLLAANISDKYNQLVYDLLAYGTAAQLFTNYKTNSPINVGYEDKATTYEAFTNNDRAVIKANTVESAKIASVTVNFSNSNKIAVSIKDNDRTLNAGDVANLKVTFNGVEADIVLDDDGVYRAYSDEIKILDFDKVFTIELTDGVGSHAISYSVNAYCASKQNSSNSAMAALARATYYYGLSGEALVG